MASTALINLGTRLGEIGALRRADPSPRGGLSPDPDLTAALNRASTVLVCSHLQGYVQDVIDETVDALTNGGARFSPPPPELIDAHVRRHIQQIHETTEPAARLELVRRLVMDVSPVWYGSQPVRPGQLIADRILDGFQNPWPRTITRVFGRVGIPDIFGAIARGRRKEFEGTIQEVVEKRNQIAHGDLTVVSAASDVSRYLRTVELVCSRIDRRLARQIRTQCGGATAPW